MIVVFKCSSNHETITTLDFFKFLTKNKCKSVKIKIIFKIFMIMIKELTKKEIILSFFVITVYLFFKNILLKK